MSFLMWISLKTYIFLSTKRRGNPPPFYNSNFNVLSFNSFNSCCFSSANKSSNSDCVWISVFTNMPRSVCDEMTFVPFSRTTIGGLIALGAEYEYADYSTSRLEDLEGFQLGNQISVEKFLNGVSTFRVGMETRIAPSFSLRAGYNHSSAMFKDEAYSALAVYRTSTDYNNVKAKNTVTFGLGYCSDVIYADMAFKYDMYKSDFYAFDDIDLPKTEVDNERLQLIFTLGARF